MQSPAKLNKNAIFSLVISLCGFLDATYLTLKHFMGGPIPCSITQGCEIVTTSKFSTIGGVPIALLGALFYLVTLLLAIWYLDRKDIRALRTISYLATAAFLISLGLLGIQAFVLHAYCTYCLASALFSTLLFGNGMLMLKLIRKAGQTSTSWNITN
jgi:uncharacterized membrane protein